MKKIYSILILLVCFAVSASAQVKAGDVISGQVWDDFDPLMMCNVVEIDHNKRIVAHGVTDINGNFSFKIVNPKNKIQISYIGCQTLVLPITKRSFGKITLKSNTTLKEVTVKAVRKSQSTGLAIPMTEISTASQTIDMKEFEGIAMTSVDEALQGRVAGLDIVANSGDVGAGTTIRLRGANTINGNQNPLIVVNGNPLDTDAKVDNSYNDEKFAELLQVNPEDIESITVLKDAAAQAIWGTRGGAGVIEIKTKRGVRGKTRVNYKYTFTGTWMGKRYKLLNGDDYTMYMKEAYFNPRQQSGFSNKSSNDFIPEIAYAPEWSEYNMYNDNTDWVDAVTQFGQYHKHSVSLTGGGEKAKFRVSGAYDYQKGYVIKQNFGRFTTNVALDYTVSDRISVSTNFDFLYMDRDYHNTGGAINDALKKMPNLSIYREDADGHDLSEFYTMNRYITKENGVYAASKYLDDQYGLMNPVALAYNSNNITKQTRVVPEFIFRYDILGTQPEQHQLRYEGQIRFVINNNDNSSFIPGWLNSYGINSDKSYNKATASSSKSHEMSTHHTLTFTPHFNREGHSLMVMGRYDYGSSNSSGQSTGRNKLPTSSDITSTLAGGIITDASASPGHNKWQNFTFQSHYSYKGRYSVTGVVRGDNTVSFGPSRPWVYSPAISARWNITNEPFMEKVKWLSMLSIRPSWGYAGNSPGGQWWRQYYTSGISYMGNGSMVPRNIRLGNLSPERKQSFQIGFDFGFRLPKGEITGNVDVYTQTTKNMLNPSFRIPSSTGFTVLEYYNNGSMRNQGWEFNINGNDIIKKGKFSMSFNVSFANNRNRVLSLDETLLETYNKEFGYSNGTYLSRVQLNNPLNSIYGFRYKGVYAYSEFAAGTEDDPEIPGVKGKNAPVARNAQGEPIYDSTGAPKMMFFNYEGSNEYVFQGGDAIYEDVNHDGQINELDIVYLGSSLPKLTGGFGTRFSYNGWELNLQFNFRAGVKVINYARMNLENMYSNNNQSIAVNWRWHNEGDVALLPRAATGRTNFYTYNWLGSDRFVEDASFIRLNYAQLSYTFQKKHLKQLGLSALRVNLTLNNIFVLTRYSGLDPEHPAYGYDPAGDGDTNPRSRQFTLGVNVSF